jgi:hypothetical protein
MKKLPFFIKPHLACARRQPFNYTKRSCLSPESNCASNVDNEEQPDERREGITRYVNKRLTNPVLA